MFGCEAWVLKERDKMRLQTMETKGLRRVQGVTKFECVKNEEIRKVFVKQEAVVIEVMKRRE